MPYYPSQDWDSHYRQLERAEAELTDEAIEQIPETIRLLAAAVQISPGRRSALPRSSAPWR